MRIKKGKSFTYCYDYEKNQLKVDVKKDELITLDMVELDENHIITKLRRKQDKLGL
ncbi:conserved domain protein [Parvimonas sp. oral taxon 393 str. F0440]|nr:conserved domain protein [Parvimonas sp. oral taxon 393 str. F0440]